MWYKGWWTIFKDSDLKNNLKEILLILNFWMIEIISDSTGGSQIYDPKSDSKSYIQNKRWCLVVKFWLQKFLQTYKSILNCLNRPYNTTTSYRHCASLKHPITRITIVIWQSFRIAGLLPLAHYLLAHGSGWRHAFSWGHIVIHFSNSAWSALLKKCADYLNFSPRFSKKIII